MNQKLRKQTLLREFVHWLLASIFIGLMTTCVLGTMVLAITSQAHADTGGFSVEPVVLRMQDVQQGSLLFKTEDTGKTGLYRNAPKVKTDVSMQISGLVVRTKVSQRFRNPGNDYVEGIYVFPLPENSAVDHLRLQVGDRVIKGVIKERREAKKIYNKAKRAGKKASLLEQERPNIFTNSVANIGPGEEIVVEIEYQQVIRYDRGEFRVRFPMVVGPRYIPGKPQEESIRAFSGDGWAMNTDQVPDASRITPLVIDPVAEDSGIHNPVSISIELDAGFPLAQVTSAYHKINTVQQDNGKTSIVLADGVVPANRDFELVWKPKDGHVPKAALFTEEVAGKHYAMLMVLPPDSQANQYSALAREVIFVIDTSGSMGGASIRQAREALHVAIDRLQPRDSFNIIRFSDRTNQMFQTARAASRQNLNRAHQYIKTLEAGGGTEMARALLLALNGNMDTPRVRQVVFLTDGSVGNESRLFDIIKQRLGGSRLFTIGIGSAPNSHFMRKAAQHGRGTFTYIGDVNTVKMKMAELFEKLESPVLTNLQIQWPKGSSVEMWPKRLSDLYQGEPVVITAKLGSNTGDVIIKGKRVMQDWKVKIPLAGGRQGKGVGVLWARNKIASLMNSLHEGVNKQQVRNEVIDVAIQHHLVSKYTSLVAVDVTPTRPAFLDLKKSLVPTNMPKGWSRSKVFGQLPQTATPSIFYLVSGLLMLLFAGFMYRSIRQEGRLRVA